MIALLYIKKTGNKFWTGPLPNLEWWISTVLPLLGSVALRPIFLRCMSVIARNAAYWKTVFWTSVSLYFLPPQFVPTKYLQSRNIRYNIQFDLWQETYKFPMPWIFLYTRDSEALLLTDLWNGKKVLAHNDGFRRPQTRNFYPTNLICVAWLGWRR